MKPPLCIDLFCGLGGWTDGFLAEGYDCIGFDIERHDYGSGGYPGQLVLQDILTVHGSQFRDAACIVASPPCQKYSYMAMPWTKAKALIAWHRESPERVKALNALFDACFRIQYEACDAAGRHIPMVVENVKGAQPWVGRAKWRFGNWYLWGDVPALMPPVFGKHGQKGFSHNGIRKKDWPHNSIGGSLAAKVPFDLSRHIASCFKPTSSPAYNQESPTSGLPARRFHGDGGNTNTTRAPTQESVGCMQQL